jgi:hypothetical protein
VTDKRLLRPVRGSLFDFVSRPPVTLNVCRKPDNAIARPPREQKDGHVTDTTPSPDSGDSNTPQDNWEGRYAGLQKVLAKRDTELSTATAELDRLRTEHEQALTDLATYRQRDVDASEEEQARQQYEQLRERFEEAPPTPVGNNQQRTPASCADASDRSFIDRERTGTSAGYPI